MTVPVESVNVERMKSASTLVIVTPEVETLYTKVYLTLVIILEHTFPASEIDVEPQVVLRPVVESVQNVVFVVTLNKLEGDDGSEITWTEDDV